MADCRCSADRIATYRRKISGPLLDRIDLHVQVLRPTTAELRATKDGAESSRTVRKRVVAARERQLKRSGSSNARLENDALQQACDADDECWALLECAAEKLNLSARAHQRVLRVARTIADLEGTAAVEPGHVAEALSLRCLDKQTA